MCFVWNSGSFYSQINEENQAQGFAERILYWHKLADEVGNRGPRRSLQRFLAFLTSSDMPVFSQGLKRRETPSKQTSSVLRPRLTRNFLSSQEEHCRHKERCRRFLMTF